MNEQERLEYAQKQLDIYVSSVANYVDEMKKVFDELKTPQDYLGAVPQMLDNNAKFEVFLEERQEKIIAILEKANGETVQ